MTKYESATIGSVDGITATAFYLEVTPEMAREWLENNIENNRRIRPSIVWKYALDMKNGNWGLNTDAIAFNADGRLINGQHRLSAVVRANIPVTMLVMFDSPITQVELMNIDRGAGRTVADSMEVAGFTEDVFQCSISTARAYLTCKIGTKNPSHQSIMKHIVDNKDTYAKLLDITKMKRKGRSGMRSIVAAGLLSAYLSGEDFDALTKFAQVYLTYDTDGCEAYTTRYAPKLKDYLASHRGTHKKEFIVVESHIYAFVHNAENAKTRDDYYVLKDEHKVA